MRMINSIHPELLLIRRSNQIDCAVQMESQHVDKKVVVSWILCIFRKITSVEVGTFFIDSLHFFLRLFDSTFPDQRPIGDVFRREQSVAPLKIFLGSQ